MFHLITKPMIIETMKSTDRRERIKCLSPDVKFTIFSTWQALLIKVDEKIKDGISLTDTEQHMHRYYEEVIQPQLQNVIN